MEYFNYIVNLHSMYFMNGSLADTAAVVRQDAVSDAAAVVNPENALVAAVIALAAGAVIYLYRHRRINYYGRRKKRNRYEMGT